MGIKMILLLIILLFFTSVFIAIYFGYVLIGFSPTFATFLLGVLAVGAFLLGAGAILPRDGRAGLSTIVISISLGVLSALSAITISLT